MTGNAPETAWRPGADVVWLPDPGAQDPELPERVYLLDLRSEIPVVLEGSAALIWSALARRLASAADRTAGGAFPAELVADLAVATGLDAREIEPDIRAFLRDLAAQGLIRPES